MIEVFLLLALVLHGLYVSLRLREAKRRDVVLFRFCEIRRRLVAHIYRRDMSGDMSRAEYLSARRLLAALNAIVGEYDHWRARMFNFREFVRLLGAYGKISGDLTAVAPPEDPELRALHEDAARALVLAFFAYTPFLLPEAALRLALRLGAAFFKEQAANFTRPLRDAERFGVKVGMLGGAKPA